jgi:phosphatidylglycerophosphate synthase
MTAVARRELATRRTAWAARAAAALARAGATPNAVSLSSIVFAAGAAAAFALVPRAHAAGRSACLLLAAATIQLRLLCNLLDGMLAVEERLETPTGVLFNEVPDRIADVLILAGAGYSIGTAAGDAALGWIAAAAALFTAYVRQLGGALTGVQHFDGPMAKQHRMFTLTVGSILAAAEAALGLPLRVMRLALAVIAAGAIATAWRRIALVAAELEAR